MKKENVLLSLLILTPLLILITIALYANINSRNPRDIFLENQSKKYFEGKILLIKNDKKNHNARTIYSKENSIKLPSTWDSKVKMNDSISKQKGKLFLKIYRNSKLIDSLNYNDLNGW